MKISNFIICDDIRYEIGNKMSLMGLYDSSIEFNVPSSHNAWPQALKLGFFIKISKDSTEETPVSFIIKMVSKDAVVELGKGKLGIPKDGVQTFTLALVNNHVQFTQPGNVNFVFEFYNEKNELIEKLNPETALRIKVHEK